MPETGDEGKGFTQEQLDAAIAEATAGLKANQAELLKEAKAAKAALKNYEGVDPKKYQELTQAAEEAERKRLASEGDFKSLEKQLVEKYEGEIGKEREVGKKYLTAMERYMIDAAAATELAKHSDSPKLLLPHIKSRMKVIEQDGEFHARIVDDSGNVRIGKGQGSAPMTLSELVEEMKQDKEFAPAFRGTGSSGGGASRSSGSAGGSKVVPAGDNAAFIANLAEIATGKVAVQ